MHTPFLIILCFCTFNVAGQPILDSTITPTFGYSYGVLNCDTAAVAPGLSGANQYWNFLLTYSDTTAMTITYVEPGNTPHASLFPNTNLAVMYPNGIVYSYYLTDADSMALIGTIGNGNVGRFTDPMVERMFPLVYGESYTDSFVIGQESNGITFEARGTRTVTYDAFGTLTINGISYQNVIRLHTVEDNIAEFGEQPTTVHSDTYEWLTAGTPDLLLRITNSIYSSGLTLNRFKTVAATTHLVD